MPCDTYRIYHIIVFKTSCTNDNIFLFFLPLDCAFKAHVITYNNNNCCAHIVIILCIFAEQILYVIYRIPITFSQITYSVLRKIYYVRM